MSCIDQFGEDAILMAIEKAGSSEFLLGKAKNTEGHQTWKVSFDWIIKPDNLQKTLEGNYDNSGSASPNRFHNFAQRDYNVGFYNSIQNILTQKGPSYKGESESPLNDM